MGTVLKVFGGAAAIAGTWVSVWWLDKLGIIDRHAFEWGDFATLTTGALAVVGAVWVGLRQVDISAQQTKIQDRQANILDEQTMIQSRQASISDNQTEILNRQVILQALSFKAELYEKRFSLYSDVQNYTQTIWVPKEFRSHENTRMLLRAMEASKFLFSDQVHEKIAEIYGNATRLSSVMRVLDSSSIDYASSGKKEIEQEQLSNKIHQNIREFTEMVTPYLRVDEHMDVLSARPSTSSEPVQ